MEKLEDEANLKVLRKAQAEDDGTRYSHEEVMAMLELTQEDVNNANLQA